MNTENKKSTNDFIFNSFKEDKSAKRKSLALDILFGLLLAAMCVLLMSLSVPENTLVEIKSQSNDLESCESVSAIRPNLFSKNAVVYRLDYTNHMVIKYNRTIVN